MGYSTQKSSVYPEYRNVLAVCLWLEGSSQFPVVRCGHERDLKAPGFFLVCLCL